jgi:hypothetical protein
MPHALTVRNNDFRTEGGKENANSYQNVFRDRRIRTFGLSLTSFTLQELHHVSLCSFVDAKTK